MSPIDVEDISEAIFEDPSNGIIVGQVMMLLKVSVFVEMYCRVVGGQDVQVNGLAVILGSGRNVIFQAFQQKRTCHQTSSLVRKDPLPLYWHRV